MVDYGDYTHVQRSMRLQSSQSTYAVSIENGTDKMEVVEEESPVGLSAQDKTAALVTGDEVMMSQGKEEAEAPPGNIAEESAPRPFGDMIVEIDGKRFYRGIVLRNEVYLVGDDVDVVYEYTEQEESITWLGKIASLFQNQDGEFQAEMAFYYDSNDDIPGVKKAFDDTANLSQESGSCNKNEVIASNKFTIVDVETFDEPIKVYSSYEEYLQGCAISKENENSTFCRKIWYSESYAVKPFNVKEGWQKVMTEYSKYNRVYHSANGDKEKRTGAPINGPVSTIIGREKEATEIKAFLETGIRQGGTGQILYICGVPGTGKTETVSMVVRNLSEKKMKGILPWFDLIEINGVHLIDPNDFYRTLYSKLMKKKPPGCIACYQLLDEYFSSNTTPCVLIVDEADYIVTKKQKVLFTIFDWPSRPSSKLIVVIISNTMNLHSKMKDSCVSRLGCGTLVFHPYGYKQILDVITAKMEANCEVDTMALELCARRVTNHNGDMRKALQICNRVLKQRSGSKVTVADMNKVANTVLSSHVVHALQRSSTVTSCFLVALVLELKETQHCVASALNVYEALRGMMAVVSPELERTISLEAYRKLLLSVAQSGIISLEPTVFTMGGRTKVEIHPDMNENLGDTGIVPEVDVGQIVTALSRDPYWERKLRDL